MWILSGQVRESYSLTNHKVSYEDFVRELGEKTKTFESKIILGTIWSLDIWKRIPDLIMNNAWTGSIRKVG